MKLSSFKWLDGDGPDSNIVLSSRLRLARNLEDIPFSHRAADELKKVVSLAEEIFKGNHEFADFKFIHLSELSELDKYFLVESHLASPYHIQSPQDRAIIIKNNGTISIMINEEDHLRMQCILAGLNLEKGWEEISKLDDKLESQLNYAYSEDWGYLTACPTNLGTGLRASTLIHLPALVFTDMIQKLLHIANQFGLVVRGLYGEGTESQGQFFQLSNQITLGSSEEEIIEKISDFTSMIIKEERQARAKLKKESLYHLSDKIWRAYGILSNSRILNSAEAMELLSMLRLGIDMEILPSINIGALNELIIAIKPATLQKLMGKELDPTKRDILRATLLRKTLKDLFERK